MGLEPTRRCQHMNLNHACLPIPALPLIITLTIISDIAKNVKKISENTYKFIFTKHFAYYNLIYFEERLKSRYSFLVPIFNLSFFLDLATFFGTSNAIIPFSVFNG